MEIKWRYKIDVEGAVESCPDFYSCAGAGDEYLHCQMTATVFAVVFLLGDSQPMRRLQRSFCWKHFIEAVRNYREAA